MGGVHRPRGGTDRADIRLITRPRSIPQALKRTIILLGCAGDESPTWAEFAWGWPTFS